MTAVGNKKIGKLRCVSPPKCRIIMQEEKHELDEAISRMVGRRNKMRTVDDADVRTSKIGI